jgi:Protein of unknown function (DUF4239)
LSFVFDLPLWSVGLVLVVVMGGLAAVGLLFMRRRVLPRLEITNEDGHFTSTIVHSVMVFYALTVAMIAITVWETYDAAAKIVSEEATALATLYRDASSYPPPAQEQLQAALREYTEAVIQEAWPEQHKGLTPRGGVERINRFQKILTGFEPTTEGQKILHAETLRSYNQMIEARRMRLDAVQTALPGLLWTVIFLGAALGVAASYFFRVKDSRLHMSLVVLLTVFFAMVIFVVFAFDRPFRGDMGIESEPYQLVYDQLMQR